MSKYVIKVHADDREWFYVGEVGYDAEELDIHNRYSSALADALQFKTVKDATLAIKSQIPAKYAPKAVLLRMCPTCSGYYVDYPALSRKDNATEICPRCGIRELLDFYLLPFALLCVLHNI